MEPIVIAVVVGIAVYVLAVALIPKRYLIESTYTRSMVQKLEDEISVGLLPEGSSSLFREQIHAPGILSRVFFTLPGSMRIYPRLLKAGLAHTIDKFLTIFLIVLFVLVYMFHGAGFSGIIIAICITYVFAWMYVGRRIKQRNRAFLNLFADALDMIVRSVRSGYPLNAAVRMVAENMQAPLSTEFKQVADETAYGSTLVESLQRLAQRIDEPDIRFFVVVLAVQQDVGGNLAEVLSNLANIIRKRKHLRMKITALTSEGRATAWVLGMLPIFEFGAIYLVAPNHLTPLFTTHLGNLLLAGAIGILLFGAFIVRQMINVEV